VDVTEVGESGQRARPDDDDDVSTRDAEDPDDDDDDDPAVPQAWRSKPFRLAVMAAVVILMAGIGFGAGKLAGVGNNVVRSDIPRPETTADPFFEGSGSIADNSHENILSTTAPGLVHILSGGKSVGIGLVLTQSGKVLTTYQPTPGARNLSAKYVLSGATFTATVIGTDPVAGLALLQMASHPGWPYVTVEVGNSDRLAQNANASSFTSYHVPGTVYDTAVGTTGTTSEVTIDAGTLTEMNVTVDVAGTTKTRSGLLASALQSDTPSVLGGPLVDLNGKVIGITIGGSGSGLDVTGYAIPINTALAVAARIADGKNLGVHPGRGAVVRPARLQPARRHHTRQADQHDRGHKLAALAGHCAQLRAQLQSDKRHHEAHESERGHRQQDREAHRAECEPHREVVQAERGAADQQPPPVPDPRGVVVAAQYLDKSPDRRHEQDPGAGPAGGGPQRAGQAGADEHPDGRHHDVAQAEDRGHLELGTPVYPADPDGDGRPEVIQPERDRHG
jgi:S1-C subfamily serine protease